MFAVDSATSRTLTESEVVAPSKSQTPRRDYHRALSALVGLVDAVVILVAVGGGHILHIASRPSIGFGTWREPASALLAVTWLMLLRLRGTRATRVLGDGLEEFKRVIEATLFVFGLTAIAAIFLEVQYARVQLTFALPIGLACLLVSRAGWRLVIRRLHAVGLLKTPVLVVGAQHAAAALAEVMDRDTAGAYQVAGIYVVDGGVDGGDHLVEVNGSPVPVLHGYREGILSAVEDLGVRAVAVTATEHLEPSYIKQLTWELEAHQAQLILAPGVTDVALPRMTLRSVRNVPLLHVEPARHSEANRLTKAVFDRTFAVVALTCAMPLMLLTAMAIKATSRGPVFYRSERIGKNGEPFQMIKFRSMVSNAETQVFSLIDAAGGKRDQLLFKMRNDPRVTYVGRVIRKLSIDELPQFFNVLRGEMSIVGPRPPLAREVAVYTKDMSRRLLVRPGLTGLWQVSGRSDLTVEQSMQLDQYYVDNWSMGFDLAIIAKTARAVLSRNGAY